MQKPWVGEWETEKCWLVMAWQVCVLAALLVHWLTNDPPGLHYSNVCTDDCESVTCSSSILYLELE